MSPVDATIVAEEAEGMPRTVIPERIASWRDKLVSNQRGDVLAFTESGDNPKIDNIDIQEEVNSWQYSVIAFCLGINPPFNSRRFV